MSDITYFDTACGLRCVHLREPRTAVAYTGVVVRAGSRDENPDGSEDGLAHFVEHTIFKGTEHRNSWHINNRMERVGGELNAFTSKQDTVVYTAFPRAYTSRALELVADLVLNSRFPTAELDKEREVVADEIDSYRDTPSEAVFDDFDDLLFAGSSLGHNILGNKGTLRTFDTAMCLSWLKRNYTAARMVLFYAGPMGASQFKTLADRYFADIPAGEPYASGPIESVPAHFNTVRHIDSHQAHTVIGARLPHLDRQQRMVAALFTNIVGGSGMNSLLNIELRERRGLVYNVDAGITNYSDVAEFSVYFGCDSRDTARCDDIVRRTIRQFVDAPITATRLAAAKRQYIGQLLLASENRENRIIAIARAMLMHGRALTDTEIRHEIDAVTPSGISAFAESLLPLDSLTFAPH